MAHNNEVYLKIDGQNYILKSDHPSEGDQGLSLRYFITPSLIESLMFFVFSIIVSKNLFTCQVEYQYQV